MLKPILVTLALCAVFLLPGCLRGTPEAPPAPTEQPSPTLPPPTPSTAPAKTPTPTAPPTPTLPAGDALACLPPQGARTSAVVVRVVDGDTIRVRIGHGEFSVRYLGLDTPETWPPPAQLFGPEATARNRELVGGQRVTLVADPQAGDKDRYDRLLRFVVAGADFVNYLLVREGLARYYASPNACGPLFYQAEQDARHDDFGLWAPRP